MDSKDEVNRIKSVYATRVAAQQLAGVWSMENPGNRAISIERDAAIDSLLALHGYGDMSGRNIIDIGCGTGSQLARLKSLGASDNNMYGIDLIPERIAMARKSHPKMTFICGNAEFTGLQTSMFDVAMLYVVFSSILDKSMATRLALEVSRILKPDGIIVWYDMRVGNVLNPNVRAMSPTRIGTLFPGYIQYLRPVTFLPPIARRLGRLTTRIYPVAARVPIFCSHYIGILTRNQRDHNPVASAG